MNYFIRNIICPNIGNSLRLVLLDIINVKYNLCPLSVEALFCQIRAFNRLIERRPFNHIGNIRLCCPGAIFIDIINPEDNRILQISKGRVKLQIASNTVQIGSISLCIHPAYELPAFLVIDVWCNCRCAFFDILYHKGSLCISRREEFHHPLIYFFVVIGNHLHGGKMLCLEAHFSKRYICHILLFDYISAQFMGICILHGFLTGITSIIHIGNLDQIRFFGHSPDLRAGELHLHNIAVEVHLATILGFQTDIKCDHVINLGILHGGVYLVLGCLNQGFLVAHFLYQQYGIGRKYTFLCTYRGSHTADIFLLRKCRMLRHFFQRCHDLQILGYFFYYIDIRVGCQFCRLGLNGRCIQRFQFCAVGSHCTNLESHLGSHCKVQILAFIDLAAAFELGCAYGVYRIVYPVHACHCLHALHVLHGNLVGSGVGGTPDCYSIVCLAVQGAVVLQGTVDIIFQILAVFEVRNLSISAAIVLGGLGLGCGGFLHLHRSLTGIGLACYGGFFFYNNVCASGFFLSRFGLLCRAGLLVSCLAGLIGHTVLGLCFGGSLFRFSHRSFFGLCCRCLFRLCCTGFLGLSLGGLLRFCFCGYLGFLFRGFHFYLGILADLRCLVSGDILQLNYNICIIQNFDTGCHLLQSPYGNACGHGAFPGFWFCLLCFWNHFNFRLCLSSWFGFGLRLCSCLGLRLC